MEAQVPSLNIPRQLISFSNDIMQLMNLQFNQLFLQLAHYIIAMFYPHH
jgi:hypothetical protein